MTNLKYIFANILAIFFQPISLLWRLIFMRPTWFKAGSFLLTKWEEILMFFNMHGTSRLPALFNKQFKR